MVKIINTSREFDNVETYLMTISPAIKSMKDVADGTVIRVDGYMFFEDVKENTGEISEIMSVITPEKEVYSCQSQTFKRSLTDIHSIMGEKKFSIVKTSGVTKAGRDYINCILDVASIQ